MLNYLRGDEAAKAEFEDSTPNSWLDNGELTSDMMLQARQFRSFAQANADRVGLQCVVADKSTSDITGNKGAVIVLYENGIPRPFEPPGQPGQPTDASVTHKSIELKWNMPKYGAQNVEFYTVSYSQSLDDPPEQWATQKTEGPQETLTVSGLTSDKVYYFKVCEVGTSLYSKVSKRMKTSPQKEPILETDFKELQKKVNHALLPIDEQRHEQQILKAKEAEIAANKNFTFRIKVCRTRKINLTGTGHHVTNCLQCNFTCHYPCATANDEDKARCSAMDPSGFCTICPCRGHWSTHVNNPYRFEEYEEEERTIDDLRKRYDTAKHDKTRQERMIAEMEKCIKSLYTEVLEMVRQSKESINQLDGTKLLTEVEYIELLIKAEKQQCEVGYQQRIQYYEELKKQAAQ